MTPARAAFYDESFDDEPGFVDAAADRNQRIADRAAELVEEALRGEGDFWPACADGEPMAPEWDLEQGNRLLAALRDSFREGQITSRLRYAKAISDVINDYAQRRAREEIDG